jgi:HYR domain
LLICNELLLILLFEDRLLKSGPFILGVLIGLFIALNPELSYSQSTSTPPITNDKIPPVIALPNDSTLEATNSNGRIVTYKVVARDQVDGIVGTTCTPASGSIFPIGTTKVLCEGTDKHGNKAIRSFQVKIQDSTPPDTFIIDSKVAWTGKINSTSSTVSDEINIEISGSDSVGLDYYECKIDSGKWARVQNQGIGQSLCGYSRLPDGIHIFQSRATDKYGNIDNSPAVFTWTVVSLKEGMQDIIKLISESNLTEKGKANVNLPLFESQKLLPLGTDDRKIDVCYNMDSFLNNINNLFLKDNLSESDKNQLISSTLSIKDRLTCAKGPI